MKIPPDSIVFSAEKELSILMNPATTPALKLFQQYFEKTNSANPFALKNWNKKFMRV
jgi:DNA-directed RNA polymerase specialized sigma54-like protein